jgi:hypothetical protein
MKLAAILLALYATSAVAQSREPIRLDPRNPHYFQYNGSTIALITSGEHYGSVINADFDYRKYLSTLHGDGLSETRLFGGSYIEVPGASFGIKRNTLAPAPNRLILPWSRSTEPGYAGGGNKFDLTKWDPEYFRRFHDFLSQAELQGVIVELSLFSSQYGDAQWKFSPFNEANNVNRTNTVDLKTVNTLNNGNVLALQERYVRKLVREAAQHPNVLFEIQNEPWSDHPQLTDVVNPYLFPPGRDQYPNSIEIADADSIAWQTRVAQWITSEESSLPHPHLIAQNYTNFRLPIRALIPGISIANFHYAYAEAATWNAGLPIAISCDETGFLGRTDDAYRRQAWSFMLAGGSAFDALDYSFTVTNPDGADIAPNGPGGGSPTFRMQLGHLAKFLSQFPLGEMKPDSTAIVHAEGAVTHALSSPGGAYAIYIDGPGPIQLRVHIPAGAYRVSWLDPVTGEAIGAGDLHSDGSDQTLTTPAFKDGIALSLKRIKN